MAAFARAVDLGYRYVETDVHATDDGVLLATHDPTLDRMTDSTGRIRDLTNAQVQEACIGGSQRIPQLVDVLHTWPDLKVNIDIKDSRAVRPLVAAIRATKAIDRVCVASFSQIRLDAVRRELGPTLCTSLTTRGVLRLRLAATHPRAYVLAPRGVPCAQVPDRLGPLRVVTAGLVAAAHARGQQVHVWTVDRPADMHRLLDLGVDGLMSDDLMVLRDVLRARNAWRA